MSEIISNHGDKNLRYDRGKSSEDIAPSISQKKVSYLPLDRKMDHNIEN